VARGSGIAHLAATTWRWAGGAVRAAGAQR